MSVVRWRSKRSITHGTARPPPGPIMSGYTVTVSLQPLPPYGVKRSNG